MATTMTFLRMRTALQVEVSAGRKRALSRPRACAPCHLHLSCLRQLSRHQPQLRRKSKRMAFRAVWRGAGRGAAGRSHCTLHCRRALQHTLNHALLLMHLCFCCCRRAIVTSAARFRFLQVSSVHASNTEGLAAAADVSEALLNRQFNRVYSFQTFPSSIISNFVLAGKSSWHASLGAAALPGKCS